MDKPIVHYEIGATQMQPVVGGFMILAPIDHPSNNVSNNGILAATSEIISVDINGYDFETKNSKYVGVHQV